MKRYLDATFKSVADSGAFTAVASMPTLDRDKEVILKGAFNPLPDTIPVCFAHNHADPVGRARPYYSGDRLMVDGWFGTTDRAQEIRQLTVDGVIGHVSVGFMDAKREERDGISTIVSGELLEVSLVSVPSNREAAVLSVRGHQVRLTEGDRWRLRLAALQAELLLLATEDAIKADGVRPAAPVDVRKELADAKAFLAELSRPATASTPNRKAAKAPAREVRCLYDVLAARNAKQFDDQAAVEPPPPSPPPPRPYTASAYELDFSRHREGR